LQKQLRAAETVQIKVRKKQKNSVKLRTTIKAHEFPHMTTATAAT